MMAENGKFRLNPIRFHVRSNFECIRSSKFLKVYLGNLQKPKILLAALLKRSLFVSFPLKSGGKLTCRSHSVQTLRKISELIEVAFSNSEGDSS